jgi:hypothetical protein
MASAVVLGSTSVASAQRAVGTIRGTVTNADTRVVVMGARVAIINPERIAIANERGEYVLRDVPAGTYSVFTTAIGRKPAQRPT